MKVDIRRYLYQGSWPQHNRLNIAYKICAFRHTGLLSIWSSLSWNLLSMQRQTTALSSCPLSIHADRCVDTQIQVEKPVQTHTLPQICNAKNLALLRKTDATATSTGTLRKHLRSQSHLNDHSSQWESFNGGLGRKEAASLLILGTLHLRWNAGKGREEAWRGRKVLCLSLSWLSCIMSSSNYHYPLHPLQKSLISLWFSESALPLFLFPALPLAFFLFPAFCLFLPFPDSPFHSHLPPLLLVPG